MKSKSTTVLIAAIAALIVALFITLKYDIYWLAAIIWILISVCMIRCIIITRRRKEKEKWELHRFVSRTLNEIEKELFNEMHKELAGIKAQQPASNVHPGSRVSDKYLAMVEEREGVIISDHNDE